MLNYIVRTRLLNFWKKKCAFLQVKIQKLLSLSSRMKGSCRNQCCTQTISDASCISLAELMFCSFVKLLKNETCYKGIKLPNRKCKTLFSFEFLKEIWSRGVLFWLLIPLSWTPVLNFKSRVDPSLVYFIAFVQ